MTHIFSETPVSLLTATNVFFFFFDGGHEESTFATESSENVRRSKENLENKLQRDNATASIQVSCKLCRKKSHHKHMLQEKSHERTERMCFDEKEIDKLSRL